MISLILPAVCLRCLDDVKRPSLVLDMRAYTAHVIEKDTTAAGEAGGKSIDHSLLFRTALC